MEANKRKYAKHVENFSIFIFSCCYQHGAAEKIMTSSTNLEFKAEPAAKIASNSSLNLHLQKILTTSIPAACIPGVVIYLQIAHTNPINPQRNATLKAAFYFLLP